MSGQDKRAYPRYKVREGAFAQYYGEDEHSVSDASLCGVYVEDADHRFTKDTVIDIELNLGGAPLTVHALVRRSDPGEGFAVEFLTGPPDLAERLEKFFSDLGTIT